MSRLGVLLALGLCACGPDNSLTGSLSEVVPLDVSRAEVFRNEEAISITYFRNRGVFLDVVARVTVYVKDVEVKVGKPISLAGEWRPGSPRTTVAHAPGGEPVRLLPLVKRGDLTLSEGGASGAATRGTFAIGFQDTGGDFGFGRTLNGTFYSKQTIDAGFGPLP